MALAVVPLEQSALRTRPVVLAGERTLTVPGALGEVVPTLPRGSVVAVTGTCGTGVATLTFGLAAAATATGEWAAAIDLDGTLGGLAAAEAGVELERFAVVRRVPPARWATVVAALLDGITLVIADVPTRVHAGDARRLVARTRERAAVLVAVGPWPVEAALRLHVVPDGVRVERHGNTVRPAAVARAG